MRIIKTLLHCVKIGHLWDSRTARGTALFFLLSHKPINVYRLFRAFFELWDSRTAEFNKIIKFFYFWLLVASSNQQPLLQEICKKPENGLFAVPLSHNHFPFEFQEVSDGVMG